MTVTASSPAEERATTLLESGHLRECPTSQGRSTECDWCRWALVTPEFTALVDIGIDATRLCGAETIGTVPAVAAAAQLFELANEVDIGHVDVTSARQMTGQVGEDTERRLAELSRHVDSVVGSGGPIDRECRQTAGAVAVASVQSAEDCDRLLGTLPSSVLAGVLELGATLSGELRLATLLPLVEHRHWRGLPALRTQPEWSRRPDPEGGHQLRQRQVDAGHLRPGSLEALVLESVVDRCTERLVELGERVADAMEPVVYRRPSTDRPIGGRLRSTLWRLVSIDWPLTFVDTGLAACWDTHVIDGVRSTSVPWVVHLAIEVLTAEGYTSAIYRDPPARASVTS